MCGLCLPVDMYDYGHVVVQVEKNTRYILKLKIVGVSM